jgi:hypothetical protein
MLISLTAWPVNAPNLVRLIGATSCRPSGGRSACPRRWPVPGIADRFAEQAAVPSRNIDPIGVTQDVQLSVWLDDQGQPDVQIVVVGRAYWEVTGLDFMAARYFSDGMPDLSFGSGQ